MIDSKASHAINEIDTKLLYLEDPNRLEAEGVVVDVIDEGENFGLVLDKTPLYVKRGGQPGDTGLIKGDGFRLVVRDVVFNKSGEVVHVGSLTGHAPAKGDEVAVSADRATRNLHSLWHSAGEAIIVAAKMSGFDEPVIGAIHYGPHQNRIEYQSELSRDQADSLKKKIEVNLDKIRRDDTAIAIINLTDKSEVIKRCGFWPNYVPNGETIRVVQIRPDYTGRPCTGTHLSRTSELGMVVIEKIKVKGGKVTISYHCS